MTPRARLSPRAWPVSGLLLPGLAVLALLLPGLPGEQLHGVPLTPVGIALLALTLFAGLALPRIGRRPAVALAVGFAILATLKLALAAVAPPVGLAASYWAGTDTSAKPERSTDFPSLAAAGLTRIDPALDLKGNAFPVHFFNDTKRFNFPASATPGRDQLPFTVRWDGWLRTDTAGAYHFHLETLGLATVTLDGQRLLAADDREAIQAADAEQQLAPGAHALRVEYQRPEARVPRLLVQWTPAPGGPLEVVSAPSVTWQDPAAPARAALSAPLAAMVGTALDALGVALVLGWLMFAATHLRTAPRDAWRKAALALLPLLFLAYGMALHGHLVGRATILSGLDDWLVYESSARDIQLNGLLMAEGDTKAPPYYGQPFYPYALAAAHALTGESLYGPLVLQMAVLGGTLALTYGLAARLFGHIGGLAALGGFWAFLQQEHIRVARQLLNDNLYAALVVASLLALVALAQRHHPPRLLLALATGLLLGVTTTTRSQFLLFVPLASLVLLVAWRRRGGRRVLPRAILALICLAVGVLLTIAPFTYRNWLVADRFVLLSSSTGANLISFHPPPPGLDLSGARTDPLYERLHLDDETRTVVEYIRRDPASYFGQSLSLGAHTIGLTGVRRHDGSVYWGFFVASLLYLAAFALPRARRLDAWLVHAFVATHLLVMMTFEADTYGFRLVIPMYAPLVAVAAQVPLAAVRRLLLVTRTGEARRVSLGLAAVVALLAGASQLRGLVEQYPQRELAYHGLGGPVAAAAAEADATSAQTIYYASSDGSPRQFGAGNLPGLRYARVKWFDPAYSIPVPPEHGAAVYQLAELTASPHPDRWPLVSCLGAPDSSGVRVLSGEEFARACLSWTTTSPPLNARFGSTAQVQAIQLPTSAPAGEPVPALLLWQPLARQPRTGVETFVHVLDRTTPDAPLDWGNGTAPLYPPSLWEPGERVLSRLPVSTDVAAIPGAYDVVLGFVPQGGDGRPLDATWPGGAGTEVPVGHLTLAPNPEAGHKLTTLPDGMRAPAQPLAGGGLSLLGLRPPPATLRPGQRLQLGLLWRAEQPEPTAAQLRLRLVRPSGEAVQETTRPLLGGRYAPSKLMPGSVVRDEQSIPLVANAPSEPLGLVVDLLDARGNMLVSGESSPSLATVNVQGRERRFDLPADAGAAESAQFGSIAALAAARVDPPTLAPGSTVTVRLAWRALAPSDVSYKVFVHVLDPSGANVVAQRDAEPRDGQAPTASWVSGEVVLDEYPLALPATLAPGDYPVEVGLYDPRTGQRLALPDGASRHILTTRLVVK